MDNNRRPRSPGASSRAASPSSSSAPASSTLPSCQQPPLPSPQRRRSPSPAGRLPLLLSPRSRPLARHASSPSSHSSASSSDGWDSDDSGSLLGSRRTSTTTVSSDTSSVSGESSDDEDEGRKAIGSSSTTVAARRDSARAQEGEEARAGALRLPPSSHGEVAGHESAPPPSLTAQLEVEPASPELASEEDVAREERAFQTPSVSRFAPSLARAAAASTSTDKSLLPLYCAPATTRLPLSASPPASQPSLLESLRHALARITPSPAPFSHSLLHDSSVPAPSPSWSPSSSGSPAASPAPHQAAAHRHAPRYSIISSTSPPPSSRTTTTTAVKLGHSAAIILLPAVTFFFVSVACLWLAGDLYYYLGFALGFRSHAYKVAFWAIVAVACVGFYYGGFWMIIKIGRRLSALWDWDLTMYERPLAPILRRLRFVSPTPDTSLPLFEAPPAGERRSGEGQRLLEGVV